MKKKISIITSAYNEEGNIFELSRQLKMVFDQNTQYDFEVLMVENGSDDQTYDKMIEIRNEDKRFKIIQLSRNFRMDGGITAGLKYARGDAAILMTANLQDKPSIISKFIKKWEEGYDNVFGIVKKRPGKSIFRKISSHLFYMVINLLTDNLIPKNASDFRLIDKKIILIINQMNERNRFMRGMFAWAGFKSYGIEFCREKRYSGHSHAPFLKVLHLAIQGIFAFSYLPIRLIASFGFIVSGCSMLLLLFTVANVLLKGVPFAGYGTIVSFMFLMFGLQFLILGVLGQYIAQIYEEVKLRPNFIVKAVHGIDYN